MRRVDAFKVLLVLKHCGNRKDTFRKSEHVGDLAENWPQI